MQLRPGFGFRETAAIVEQLSRLGFSHLYLSPVLQAVPGSTHGYDVIDHSRVNAELGGEDGFRTLAETLRSRGMGILLDIVPNHMAIHPQNRWWWDVLENGRSSAYALYFDVSWDPPEPKLKDLILVPVLGDHYGRELDRGALRLERESERIVLRYQDHVLPLAPESLDPLLARVAERVTSDAVAEVGRAAGSLPQLFPGATRAERLARHRSKEDLTSRVAELCSDPELAPAIDREVARLNADPDRLDELLRRQHYRIAYWRTAARELDYRRFFDINELVALRVEDPEMFDAVHARVLGWLADGTIDGVRVDHVDGLRDPRGYLERLRSGAGERAWIVVEKILHHDERLRASWPIDGTTGYETADLLTRLFIDPHDIGRLTETYRAFTGEHRDFGDIAVEAKHEVMRGSLAADVDRVTALLVLVCEGHRRHRDHTRDALRDLIRELTVAMAVYRTYSRATPDPDEEDERWLDGAIGILRRRRPDIDPELVRFVRSLMAGEVRGDVETELVMRFQQLTAPVFAMAIEDRAFYRYARLVALNEVGGDPARTVAPADELHRRAAEQLRRWPRSLVTGSTHDTKRSEGVRARLVLLPEIAESWSEAVARWSAHNERHRTVGLPDREMEYLFYQTLVGAHPLPVVRALAYMEKAAREAESHTSWTAPDARYERALSDFVRGTLDDPVFTADLDAFVAPLVRAGRETEIAQALVRCTTPGIPDVYQGTELWDLSLVDPDDRRPVDHDLRRRLIRDLDRLAADDVLRGMDDGLPKLHVLATALTVRREHPATFAEGSYRALAAEGERADHVIGYLRGDEVATIVPRWVMRLAGDWRDTRVRLPEGQWCDRLTGTPRTGGERRMAELLEVFPVALLTRA